MELNEVKKRFKRCILEYTNAAGSFDLSEDGEDDASAMGGAAPADGGGNAPMGGAPMNGNGDMDGGMPTDGGDPNAMGGAAPAQAPNGFAPQGVDPNAGMDGMGSGAAADGSMPMDGGDPNAMGATTEEPGDEVIDVDELVKAQDEAQHKIDSMSSKFDKLMGAIDVLIQQIRIERHKRQPQGKNLKVRWKKKSYPASENDHAFNKVNALYNDTKRVCK